ncbi:TRF2-interacting telomeric protein/Rap1 C terminal domain-containing protein [Xylaria sp. FL1777]|nr:TRF2-interacting telomeric protein/Rap1 C terminal domain-containing protein [Xylaria sp. FL1777]
MSAPGITYSGVLAEMHANSSADAGVGIFRGLKFWVSVRVPQRKACVDNIEEHGGTIVPKELNADILICDEAKGPVPGSYSYQLISHAIKEGSLDTKEDYMCDRLATRPGSSNKLVPRPKLTRSKFTEEDDRILIRFVTEKGRLGESTGGNEIYKSLAEEYPHHTWQSWRDRWAKKLKSIPRPPGSDREQSPKSNGKLVAPNRGPAPNRSPVARTRARFTAEEDDILLETIHRAIENHEPWNGYPPYKQLASEFPQRTYLSWRERALNHVAKQNKDQIAQWEFEAGFHPSDNEDTPMNTNEKQTSTAEKKASTGLAVTASESENVPMQADNGSSEGIATHNGTNEGGNERKFQDTVSSPLHRARSTKPSPNTKHPAKGDAPNYSASSPISDKLQLPDNGITITTEGQFYRDYNTFLDSVGVTERRIPSVRGKAIPLWDLWQAVRSKKVETVELDWQQIAEDLGFDWVSMESVPHELQECYEEHLSPFADAMMSFNDSSDEEDSTEDADAEIEQLLPSSPPVLPSLKRALAATGPVYIPQSSPKRRRIDRSHEIPSTPSPVKGNLNSRSLRSSNKTPTNSRINHSSVTESVSGAQTRPSARKGDDISLLRQSQEHKRRLEPETQDFDFGPDTQVFTYGEGPDHSDHDSQRGTTPSQQLLLESDTTSLQTQINTPDLSASRQEISQTTPTPHYRIRVPQKPDGSDDDNLQRSTKRSRNTRTPLSPQQAQSKRRVLPPSFTSKPPASSIVVQTDQASSTTVPKTESHRKTSPPEETPDDIIDHFVSLGYSKDIVLRSLKATSWIIGNAGQVMEMLKQGEPLPPRTTGVWTQRDDDSLALVYSHSPPSTTKDERKREKEMKRLQAKHGTEQIALRKRYLLDELPE